MTQTPEAPMTSQTTPIALTNCPFCQGTDLKVTDPSGFPLDVGTVECQKMGCGGKASLPAWIQRAHPIPAEYTADRERKLLGAIGHAVKFMTRSGYDKFDFIEPEYQMWKSLVDALAAAPPVPSPAGIGRKLPAAETKYLVETAKEMGVSESNVIKQALRAHHLWKTGNLVTALPEKGGQQ